MKIPRRLRRLVAPTITAAALAGCAIPIGIDAAPAQAQTGIVTELWDEWQGTGAPWPRQIDSSGGYVCFDVLQSGLTGANNSGLMENMGYFPAGDGSAPQLATPVAYIYTRRDGTVVASPSPDASPEGWNGVPPVRYTSTVFFGGSSTYQPPTQLLCTQTVALADTWPDDSATMTGNCLAGTIQDNAPGAQPAPYVWSGLANGSGAGNYYATLQNDPNFLKALQAAAQAGLVSADTRIGTWTILKGLVQGTMGLGDIVGAGAVTFLATAINDVFGEINGNQSAYFTSTAWSVESSNSTDWSWVAGGPPGVQSAMPSQIAVQVYDNWGTFGANVAMGFQCSASTGPVGAPLNLMQSVLDGETPITPSETARATATARAARAVPMKTRPNGWFDLQSLGQRARGARVSLNLSNSPQLVSPGVGPSVVRLNGGNDRAAGGGGNDRLFGGPGRDVLYGGAQRGRPGGHDLLDGGPGRDLLSVFDASNRSTERDVVACGSGTDYVQADLNDVVGGDCEFVFRGPAQVRAVRSHFRAAPNKATALRTIGRVPRG